MLPPLTVLFVCTGNSARSILAEAAANHRSIGRGLFRASSAGSHPTGRVNPLALELLEGERISTDGLRSKSWDEFAQPGSAPLDVVVTVCDQAAGEACPIWPGRPATAHWGVPDPAAVAGSDEMRREAFRTAFDVLRRRIERFASLPLDRLTASDLGDRLREIGRTVR